MKNSKKLIIKIGSSLLTNSSGGIRKSIIKNVVEDIFWLIKNKKEVIIVSSGAISLGKSKLNLHEDLSLNESQAVAARGQIELMTAVAEDSPVRQVADKTNQLRRFITCDLDEGVLNLCLLERRRALRQGQVDRRVLVDEVQAAFLRSTG